jgi:hypothetical protein
MKALINSLFLTGFLLISSLNAQTLKEEFTIEKSPVFKIDRSDTHSNIIPLEDNSFFAVSAGKRGIRKEVNLLLFNSNMQLKKENEISLKFGDDKHEFERLLILNDKLCLITSYADRKSKLKKLFLSSINQNTLEVNKDSKVISTIDFSESNKYNSGFFSIHYTADSSKLAIFNLLPYDKKEPLKFTVNVLDLQNDFSSLWEKSFTTSQEAELVNLQKVRVNSLGEVLFLFKMYDDKRVEKVQGKPNFNYEILYVSDNGQSENTFPIQLNDDFIFDIEIAFNKSNNIISSGFYSSKNYGKIKGCYYLLLDRESKAILKESKKEFGIDFLTEFLSERKAKKTQKKKEKGKDVELASFQMEDIVTRDDGGIVQVAEQYYQETYTYTDANGFTHTRVTYHYNTLIVISISPEGEIEWARKIPKFQASPGGGIPWMSYGLEVVHNKMYFFHIDDAKNLLAENYKDMKGWSLGKRSVLIATELDVEGYKRKDMILDAKVDKTIVLPRNIIKLNKNELLMFAKWDNKARYYKVRIAEQ